MFMTHSISQTTKELITKYVDKEKVKINIINVQQQEITVIVVYRLA